MALTHIVHREDISHAALGMSRSGCALDGSVSESHLIAVVEENIRLKVSLYGRNINTSFFDVASGK